MYIALDDLKQHLRIEVDEEDEYLTRLLAQSEAACLDFCLCDRFENPAPEPVNLAILLHAGYFHANREGGDPDSLRAMMTAFHALLWPYRDLARLV